MKTWILLLAATLLAGCYEPGPARGSVHRGALVRVGDHLERSADPRG